MEIKTIIGNYNYKTGCLKYGHTETQMSDEKEEFCSYGKRKDGEQEWNNLTGKN